MSSSSVKNNNKLKLENKKLLLMLLFPSNEKGEENYQRKARGFHFNLS